ncbi:MAG: hypothetical protein IPL23_18855 [Saprospiraceae bacterium]|nr:hypothetical protein [Saprospiraceae bacterium]
MQQPPNHYGHKIPINAVSRKRYFDDVQMLQNKIERIPTGVFAPHPIPLPAFESVWSGMYEIYDHQNKDTR